MTGLWIGLSGRRSFEEVERVFKDWFPKLAIGNYEQLMQNASAEWPPIVLRIVTTESEFPTVVSIELFPGPHEERRIMPVMIELARRLAATFTCRSICDGSGYGDSGAPYWAIIWDANRAYLADDCESAFADGEGGPVKIVRELELLGARLSETGLILCS